MDSGKLSIGILYESREKILRKWDHLPEDVLYHWREPEEIDAVENALTHWGHGVSRIGDIDDLLHTWKNGDLPELVWNLSVDVVSRNRTALAPAVLEQAVERLTPALR